MTLSRGIRRVLIFVVAIALLGAALLAATPLIARELTLYYLAQAGVDAQIDNVDVNLLTGTIAYDGLTGQTQRDEGFRIGHLDISIDYLPLLSKQLRVTRLAVADAILDVRRTADNAVRVGGITVLSDQPSGGSLNWGIAIEQLGIGGLSLRYSQPATDDFPAVERELVFNQSNARDVVSWEPDNDVPLDADLSVGDSRIRLQGRVTPFGRRVSAHFEITTEQFALDLLSPITQAGRLERLTGTLDGHQAIDLTYGPDAGLDIQIDGQTTWQDSRLELAGGPALSSDRFEWQGGIRLHLLGPVASSAASSKTGPTADAAGAPEPASDDGLAWAPRLGLTSMPSASPRQAKTTPAPPAGADTVSVDAKIDVTAFEIAYPDGVTLRQAKGAWDGTTTIVLTGDGRRLTTDGTLTGQRQAIVTADGTATRAERLNWKGRVKLDLTQPSEVDSQGALGLHGFAIDVPDGLQLSSDEVRFDGATRTKLGTGTKTVHTDGQLDTAALSSRVPAGVTLASGPIAFKGTTDTRIGASAPTLATDGQLNTRDLSFEIVDSATFTADHLNWQGTTSTDFGPLLARTAQGQLSTDHAGLALPGTAISLSAARLAYDGRYAEQPQTDGSALKLTMAGEIDSHDFKVMNTDIQAPWVAALQTHAAGLSVNGLDRIRLDSLTSHGVRVLGDTDSDVAVLQSVTTTADQFRLDDLRDYRLARLDLDGASIHVRRDRQGMGVMAEFFAGSNDDDAGASGSGKRAAADGPANSYAFSDVAISGPVFMFNDVAVDPPVAISGSNINLAIQDLDTAQLDQSATYRLAMDVGAYGHLDSRGTIAPMANGGMNMNLDAWLRSLAMKPLSGYLNAALGRRIANGVADGTLHLEASAGQLDGNLDTTLSNFRLVDDPHAKTDVALGISLDTALALVRGQDDLINFETLILGDVTNPYFSIKNLVREAVLAGLRTAIMSDYSPLGLLNRAKNAVLNLGRSLVSKPAGFELGKHYIRPADRQYLGRIAQAMRDKPDLHLTVQGHAVPGDADQMSLFHGASVDEDNLVELKGLARKRGEAVRDYLAARDVNPDRISLAEPVVDRSPDAQAQATFDISGR
ncbi:DUF748 domain-containing protein [Salinisphaera sp. T31B1]|uniref:DUF748 domain-containing protein n=1 Tax=Salinisphaera sp. T31B1 TaxID=727963 RepID=UPI003341C45F